MNHHINLSTDKNTLCAWRQFRLPAPLYFPSRSILTAVVLLFGLAVGLAAPEAPTFSIPGSPGALGGTAPLPEVDPDPPAPSPNSPYFEVSGNVKNGYRLQWSEVPYEVAHYLVERRTGASGWVTSGTVGPTTFTYLDTDVRANRRYHYRVVPMVEDEGEFKRKGQLGPGRRMEWDEGSFQSHGRSGVQVLYGFGSFLPDESNNVFGKLSVVSNGSKTDFTNFSAETDYGTLFWIFGHDSQQINISTESKFISHVTPTLSYREDGRASGDAYYADSNVPEGISSSYRMVWDENGIISEDGDPWEQWWGSEVVYRNPPTNSETTKVYNSNYVVVGVGSYRTYYDATEKSTLSDPISSEDALPLARAKLAPWSEDDWGGMVVMLEIHS